MARSTISLRRHLLTRLVWWVLPIALISMGVHWSFERTLIEGQFEESLVDKAMTLAALASGQVGGRPLELASEYMPQYSREDRPFVFQIWSPEGRVLQRSGSLHGEDLPLEYGSIADPVRFTTTLADGSEYHCVTIRFPTPSGSEATPGEGLSPIVAVGGSSDLLREHLRRGYGEIVLMEAVSILGIFVAVLVALSTGVRLLERVNRQVRRISPASLGQPLDEDLVPIEIRPIVASLNHSLLTIRDYVAREQRFNSDVAHELRTPIAELRAAADIAQRWPDDESYGNLVSDAQGIARQMGGLVEGLLQLSAVESGMTQTRFERFDLTERLALLVDQVNRRGSDGRQVSLDAQGALALQTNPYVWELALRNLLDNALSYSPPGSLIRVALCPEGGGARVQVSNPTDSLDVEGAAHCTERLWRADRSEDSTHFGLGLSIVQAACAQLSHGLSVQLREGVFQATIAPLGAAAGRTAG